MGRDDGKIADPGNASGPLQPRPRSALHHRLRTPFARWRMWRRGRFGEMARLGRSVERAAPPPGAPRVLVVQLKEGPVLGGYSAVLAQALKLRGADVGLLICAGGQPICEVGWARRDYPYPCDRCSFFTETWARKQRIRTFRLRDGMPWGRDASRAPLQVPADAPALVDYAEATRTSVPRYFLAGETEDMPLAAEVTRDFTVAAYGVERALQPVFDEFGPDVVVMHNGLTTSEHVVKRLAEQRGARAVTYSGGFPPDTLVLSNDEPAIYYRFDRAWDEVRDQPLTADQARTIEEYMLGRSAEFAPKHDGAGERVLERLGAASYERVVTLFTNIAWDTAVLGRDVAFDSMRSWVVEAIAAAREHPGTALIVRIHPQELTWGSAEPIADVIAEVFPQLPDNVRVVGPDEAIDSYALMECSDRVLTYTSTTGLEAVLRGRRVAVAGDAHYRGKGFTTDVASIDQLRAAIAGTDGDPEPDSELAWRYAFMFFFRMCIPFPAVDAPDPDVLGPLPVDAAALTPGADPYLDFVCERICSGGEFLLPAERVRAPEPQPAPPVPAAR